MRLPPRLPSNAELDRRLQASKDLAARAQVHIDRAHDYRTQNKLAEIIVRSLGISTDGNGGHSH